MRRVNTVDENLKEIFDEQEEQRQKSVDLIEELTKENAFLWKVVDQLKAVLRRV